MGAERVEVSADAFCISDRYSEAEVQLRSESGRKVLAIYTRNYNDDACFIELGMPSARALRDWLNEQDLDE